MFTPSSKTWDTPRPHRLCDLASLRHSTALCCTNLVGGGSGIYELAVLITRKLTFLCLISCFLNIAPFPAFELDYQLARPSQSCRSTFSTLPLHTCTCTFPVNFPNHSPFCHLAPALRFPISWQQTPHQQPLSVQWMGCKTASAISCILLWTGITPAQRKSKGDTTFR